MAAALLHLQLIFSLGVPLPLRPPSRARCCDQVVVSSRRTGWDSDLLYSRRVRIQGSVNRLSVS